MKYLIIVILVVGIAMLAPLVEGVEAYSWPQFHGPLRNNVSLETGLMKSWPQGGPELLWTARGLGHGFSSMSIRDGMICTVGNVGKDTVITALGLDGKPLWSRSNGPAWTAAWPGSRSTPTFDGDRLYHQSPLGNIVCLKAKTGDVLWEKNILRAVKSKNSTWGLAESLLIDGDRLISCPGGPETSMVALSKHNGEFIWKAPSIDQLAGYCSPVVIDYAGLRIVVSMTAKALIGVNIKNGKLLWRVKNESYADENIMAPIFHNGCLFISTLKAGSVKWKLVSKAGKIELKELWRNKELDNHHGGMVLLGEYLYGSGGFRNANQWVCLDWETGQILQMEKGVGKGSLTSAGGMLYTLNTERRMGLVRATPTKIELISSFMIPPGGEGKSWAHPVVCNGRLYVRHSDFMYAYKIR